jgi:Glycosyl hydrolases family 16
MNVDQLDELIRKYLSTGVAMVLVLVGPAAAPSMTAGRPPTAATSAHSTGAAPTNSRGPSRHDTSDRADPTTGSYDARPGSSENTDGRTAKPTTEPSADPAEHPGKSPTESRSDDATAGPTTDPTEQDDPADKGHTPDTRSADDGRTAATTYGWGTPNREDDFTEDLSGWGLYDGPGHANKGTRSPSAAKVADGVLTIDGDADGTTAGMAWDRGKGQKYGRWEGRVRAPASDPTYNALLLLWPDAEDFPRGGEIDFMEMTDHTRQATNVFLHHGEDNAQEHGIVKIDATQWHNWAVEWTPKGITTYVDGKQWWHTDNTAALPPGPMHLCVQLDWFPQKGGGGVKPSQMQVDWVRQYPLDAPPSDKSVMRDLITRTFGW